MITMSIPVFIVLQFLFFLNNNHFKIQRPFSGFVIIIIAILFFLRRKKLISWVVFFPLIIRFVAHHPLTLSLKDEGCRLHILLLLLCVLMHLLLIIINFIYFERDVILINHTFNKSIQKIGWFKFIFNSFFSWANFWILLMKRFEWKKHT